MGIAYPVVGPSFGYREYAGGQRSLEAAVMKKVELRLVIHFFKESWNKLVLACILCKKNCKEKIRWNNLIRICNIFKSVVIEFLRTMVISPVHYVVWMSGPG